MTNSHEDFINDMTLLYIESMKAGKPISLKSLDLTKAEKQQIEGRYETDLFLRVLVASTKDDVTETINGNKRKPCSAHWSEQQVRNLISSTIQQMRQADDA